MHPPLEILPGTIINKYAEKMLPRLMRKGALVIKKYL
jgi:hypothetical protein